MRPLFSNTLYEMPCPEIIKELPPFLYQQITHLWEEMKGCWGNTPNINKWIKNAVAAANRGGNSDEKLQNLQKYIEDSGYNQRKEKMNSAIKEYNWKPGLIYILTNPYMPDLIKVGKVWGAGKTAHDRIKDPDLKSTGVPCMFNVEFEIFTINTNKSETKCHDILPCRVDRSEFFRIKKIEHAKSIIIEVVKKVDHSSYLESIRNRQMQMNLFNS